MVTDVIDTGPRLEPVFDVADDLLPREKRGGLTPELLDRYGGDLHIPLRSDRPTVIANFVETLDGVIALDTSGRTGGREVSGFDSADRFVMGLLRSISDVVLIGASAVRASHAGARTPARVFPDAGDAYAELRRLLGLPPAPVTMVATTSGDVDPAHPLFHCDAQVVVAAPAPVALELERRGFGRNVTVARLADGVPAGGALVEIAHGLGARVVLSEAGPRLFGAFVGENLMDELFLTVAPQLAGRDAGHQRLAMLEDTALWPDRRRWAGLASARHAGSYLYLRYRFREDA
jgi:riboflavin biosynthesis pyrimidine reductase